MNTFGQCYFHCAHSLATWFRDQFQCKQRDSNENICHNKPFWIDGAARYLLSFGFSVMPMHTLFTLSIGIVCVIIIMFSPSLKITVRNYSASELALNCLRFGSDLDGFVRSIFVGLISDWSSHLEHVDLKRKYMPSVSPPFGSEELQKWMRSVCHNRLIRWCTLLVNIEIIGWRAQLSLSNHWHGI